MSKLEQAMYSPLHESDVVDTKGWVKETVNYCIKHKRDVERQIRGLAKGFRKQQLQTADIEDIFSELMVYLYKCDDYNIEKAIERSSTGNIVSLEGYVNTCIKYAVIRYCNSMNTDDKNLVPEEIYDENGKEVSIFNTIPDESANIDDGLDDYDLETLCRCYEPLRYRYGQDIYQIMYIRILTTFDRSGKVYDNTLSLLGISKRDLRGFDKDSEDSAIRVLAKAITLVSLEEATSILERYVYSAHSIREAILAQLK